MLTLSPSIRRETEAGWRMCPIELEIYCCPMIPHPRWTIFNGPLLRGLTQIVAVASVKSMKSGLARVRHFWGLLEPFESWFFNPSNTPQSTASGAIVASTEGDFIERGERIATAVRSAGVSVALYHTDLSDQIAAYVASRRPAPIQVNVNHGVEMAADLFDGFIHLTQSGLKRTRFSLHPAAWIPPSSDIESQLHLASFQTRQNLGIESASTVSATFAALPHGSLNFVKIVIELLKRFPHHFHLFAGGGDVRSIRGLIHSEGVLPRVRFLGPMTDVTSLLGLIDVCLAPFPSVETTGVLDAMGAGKPVVVKQGAEADELVDEKELSADSDAAYIRIADRLFRDPAFRLKLGDAAQSRFQLEFRPERFADRVLNFIEGLAPSDSESPRTNPPSSQ